MNEEQFKQAAKLKEEAKKIKKELGLWEKELTKPCKLGYLQGWNNNHAVKLDTSVHEDIFNGFRLAAMNWLKLRLVEIDEEFEGI